MILQTRAWCLGLRGGEGGAPGTLCVLGSQLPQRTFLLGPLDPGALGDRGVLGRETG